MIFRHPEHQDQLDERGYATRLPRGRLGSPFVDPRIAHRFDEDGFVAVPLLGKAEIAALASVLERHAPADLTLHVRHDFSSTFFSTVFVDDLCYRARLRADLQAVMRPALDRVFANYRAWHFGFVARLPGGDAYEPHTDPSFVDEARHVALHLWCPIEDVSAPSGALQVLPGSHRLSSLHRGGTLPCRLRPHAALLQKHMVTIDTPAGTSVAFHPGTLHGSTPNRSGRARLCAGVLISHAAASLQTAYRDPARPDAIDIYLQPDDYFIRSKQFTEVGPRPPALGQRIGSVPFGGPPLSWQQVERDLSLGTDSDGP